MSLRIGLAALFGGWALVAAFRPVPALAGASQAAVFAEFQSSLGAQGIRKVQLFVDGVDVTASADISSVRVAWSPAQPLASGEHQARALITDALGKVIEQPWTFTVAGPVTPELLLFLTKDLLVDLDPLPREVGERRLVVKGTTLPGVEVVLRVEGGREERVMASASGRFRAELDLDEGSNDIEAHAMRLDTGEVGPDVRQRVTMSVAPLLHVPPPRDLGSGDVPDGPGLEHGAGGGLDLEPKPVEVESQPGKEPPSDLGGGRVPAAAGGSRDVGAGGDLEPLPVEETPVGEVIITKPNDGQAVHADHVTVLGLAPAGARVVVLVNGAERGEDVANPAGHFTVPRVSLDEGRNELVAEAHPAGGGEVLRSEAVVVESAKEKLALEGQPPAGVVRPSVTVTSPTRNDRFSRGAVQRIEGMAWSGARIEVDVNGRLAATEIAGAGGRFVVDVPLETGPNTVFLEAWDDAGRSARSSLLSLIRGASARGDVRPRAPGTLTPHPVAPRIPAVKLPEGVRPRG